MRNGQRVGSGLNQKYELCDDKEGLAYLRFRRLRANYIEVCEAMTASLEAGIAPRRLLGIDVPRAVASVKYFVHLAATADDKDLHAACQRCLKLLEAPASRPPPSNKRKVDALPAHGAADSDSCEHKSNGEGER